MLESIESPDDLGDLSYAQLGELAADIRAYLVESVSKTGGHLGPNLGVVELTIGLHRVFDSPRDSIVFDTGHQSYVHKLLTGRRDFSDLRKRGGVAGYPSRAESEHDIVENSHASTALSWAAGIGRANTIAGRTDRTVVAVIGDGALTGGMAWEALNSLADCNDRVVIVVNDNGRSYAPTIGGLARKFDGMRTDPRYEAMLGWGKRTLTSHGRVARGTFNLIKRAKHGVKDLLAPQGMFEDLGLKYVGPVDGHNLHQIEHAFEHARDFGGPVIVHLVTDKGRGYQPAETHDEDKFHAVGKIHPETGLPIEPSRFGWTAVFSEEMVKAGREREDLVAITAAMLAPVGLAPFQAEFPERVIDVGIAEQHAVTAAAGLAFAGMHPVFAVYATFLNRAFDQLLMDVALHKAGVTFMLDRAGVTGDDGPSHNGMWDLALLRSVPGIRLAAPRDEAELRRAFRESIEISDGPSVVRYPKGELSEPLPAFGIRGKPASRGGMDLLAAHGKDPKVAVLGMGAMAQTAVDVAGKIAAEGIDTLAASATWVLPVPEGLLKTIEGADVVVTIEDGLIDGGIGEAWAESARRAGIRSEWVHCGIPREFIEHASRAQVVEHIGLEPATIAGAALAKLGA